MSTAGPVLTSLQWPGDRQTGSQCHLTEILAPCPIPEWAQCVCCQHKYSRSLSCKHMDREKRTKGRDGKCVVGSVTKSSSVTENLFRDRISHVHFHL